MYLFIGLFKPIHLSRYSHFCCTSVVFSLFPRFALWAFVRIPQRTFSRRSIQLLHTSGRPDTTFLCPATHPMTGFFFANQYSHVFYNVKAHDVPAVKKTGARDAEDTNGARWTYYAETGAPSYDLRENWNLQHPKVNYALYKTELCKTWDMFGACPYEYSCVFAHGREELRAVFQPSHFKTRLCSSFFDTGVCCYGTRCKFSHDSFPRETFMGSFKALHTPNNFFVQSEKDAKGTDFFMPRPFCRARGCSKKKRRLEVFKNLTKRCREG